VHEPFFILRRDETIVPSPSFSEYDFGAHLMGAQVVAAPIGEHYQYDIQAILSAVTERKLFISVPLTTRQVLIYHAASSRSMKRISPIT
jgi:hypothetical protein